MHTLPKLGYAYDALEPYIDARTMELHHTKHHQTYIDRLNSAIKGTDFENKPVEELVRLTSHLPAEIRIAVRNHGGGHVNHTLFWQVIAPGGRGRPEGRLAAAIDEMFGSFDGFKKDFGDAAKNLFGSGWAWLVSDNQGLEVVVTQNQDSPLMTNRTPILGVDLWEHAYYLKYQNKRADYVDNLVNIINWEEVSRRYAAQSSRDSSSLARREISFP